MEILLGKIYLISKFAEMKKKGMLCSGREVNPARNTTNPTELMEVVDFANVRPSGRA